MIYCELGERGRERHAGWVGSAKCLLQRKVNRFWTRRERQARAIFVGIKMNPAGWERARAMGAIYANAVRDEINHLNRSALTERH